MLIPTVAILIVTVRTQRDKTPAIELKVLASLSVNRSTPHVTLGRSKEVWVSLADPFPNFPSFLFINITNSPIRNTAARPTSRPSPHRSTAHCSSATAYPAPAPSSPRSRSYPPRRQKAAGCGRHGGDRVLLPCWRRRCQARRDTRWRGCGRRMRRRGGR
jgi:hypothetical protein